MGVAANEVEEVASADRQYLTIFDGGNGFDTLVDRPNAFDEVAASINFEAIV